MIESNKVKVEFGIPEHGWLFTYIAHREFKLELDISNVPLNPMVQLCDALIEISKGIKEPTRVVWHLEPYCYYLQLEKLEVDYKAIILESDEFGGPAELTKEISGTFEEIVLPFYRAIKKFYAKTFRPPHWDELDSKRIEELTKLIKEKKNNS